MDIQLQNIEVKWPRLNQWYEYVKFPTPTPDGKKGENRPCDPLKPLAKREVTLRLTQDQAGILWQEMCKAWAEKKEPTWPAQPDNPMKAETDQDQKPTGYWLISAKKKGTYDGQKPTQPPKQYDQMARELPDDFELTTGSICNFHLTLIAYSGGMGNSVSLRLQGLQVVTLAERQEYNPFKALPGAEDTAAEPTPAFAPVGQPAPAPAAPAFAPAPQAAPAAPEQPAFTSFPGLPDVPKGGEAPNDLNDEIPF